MDNEKATIKVKPVEAIELLQKLPKEERLRVEGVIIGLSMANRQPHPEPSQASA